MSGPTYTASHWGSYQVEVSNGRLKALHGLPNDPTPSPIGQGWLDTLDDACRITQPMVRRSFLERGHQATGEMRAREAFVAVSWSEAESLVARELSRVASEYGNEAIFAGSYGWASAGKFHHGPSQLHRFLNCIGGYTSSINTYSFAAAEVILPHVLDSLYSLLTRHTPWVSVADHANLVVAFGGLPLKNSQVNMGGSVRHAQAVDMQHAQAKGVEFVNISPSSSDVMDELDAQWLAIRPSTDVALMLGLAHTLLERNLHDREFLSRYCVGFEVFRDYLLGEKDGVTKDAQWASGITDIPAARIRELAVRMALGRTLISLSWSLTRQDHGEQPYWVGITLAAMLGQIGLPGGGIGFGYSAINSVGAHSAKVSWASMERTRNPVSRFIPVARIADLLLKPGESFDYNGKQHQYPDIKLVYWVGGNPFHHHQDLNRLVRAWKRPQTIIVHEPWWNALARRADIVLPATLPPERNDLFAAPREGFILAAQKAVEPYAQAKNDYDIFSALARRLGVEHDYTHNRTEMEWIRHLYDVSRQRASRDGHELPGFDEFWKQGLYEAPAPRTPEVMLSGFRENPKSSPLPTPSGKIEIFSAVVDGFGYEDCPGHGAWMEPAEWLGHSTVERYPLHLISNQPKTRLHSQLDNGAVSRESKVRQREVVTINPHDAAARNIADGDIVRIHNNRGQCLAAAAVSGTIRQGVVVLPTGAWYDPHDPSEVNPLCKHGNPNVLTLDKGTSRLAQGAIAHSCLVEVERWCDPVPEVTAFTPPAIETL